MFRLLNFDENGREQYFSQKPFLFGVHLWLGGIDDPFIEKAVGEVVTVNGIHFRQMIIIISLEDM